MDDFLVVTHFCPNARRPNHGDTDRILVWCGHYGWGTVDEETASSIHRGHRYKAKAGAMAALRRIRKRQPYSRAARHAAILRFEDLWVNDELDFDLLRSFQPQEIEAARQEGDDSWAKRR